MKSPFFAVLATFSAAEMQPPPEPPVPGFEPLRAVALTSKFPRQDHLTTAGPGLDDPSDRGVPGAAEMPAALERGGELLAHQLRVQARRPLFLHFDLGVIELEPGVDILGQPLDELAAVADEDPRPARRSR